MLESIRARLLLWYTLVLTLLIVLYAGAVTYVYFRTLVSGVDLTLTSIANTIVQSLAPGASGTLDLNFPPQFRESTFGPTSQGTYYVVWNGNGDLLDRSGSEATPPPRPAPGAKTREGARELVLDGPDGARILVGQPLTPVYQAVRSLALTIAGAGGAVLLLSFAGGFFLASRALAPVARISRTAGAMIGGDLSARIPVQDTDSELEQVAQALNGAFDRLQTAVERQRQFTADASHEFRTPLATLRAEFEWALKRPRSEADYRDTIGKAHETVQRLTDIADRLLTLARRESAESPSDDFVDLSRVSAETVRLLQPLAAERGIAIDTELAPASVEGDSRLLAEALSNLITNAIRYNHPNGRITVSVRRDGEQAEVVVRDTGIGISKADLPRIFDRFYRADRSRGRDEGSGGGAGLGLAIVKQIVDAHRGTVTCASTPEVGTTFTLRFPAAGAQG